MNVNRRAGISTLVVVVVVIVVVAVAGVVAYVALAPQPKYSAKLLTGFAVASGKDAIFYTAVDKGFYNQSGITVTIDKGTGYLATTLAVAQGTYTFGVGDVPSLITVNENATVVKSIGLINDLSTVDFVSINTTGIRTPQDMIGKTYATYPGLATSIVTPLFLQSNGINPSQLKTVTIAAALQVQALLQGQVDFIAAFEDVLTPTAQAAAVAAHKTLNVMPARNFNMDIYGATLVASVNTINNNPELVRRFLKGTYMAVQYLDTHRAEGVSILLNHYPELNPNVVAAQLDAVMTLLKSPTALTNGYGWHTQQKMAFSLNVFAQAYGVTPKGTATDYYTNDFLPGIKSSS